MCACVWGGGGGGLEVYTACGTFGVCVFACVYV